MPKRCQNDAETMPKRCQNAPKTMPKRRQNATKTPPKRHQTPPKRHQTPPNPSHFHCFLWEKHTIRARGESNRVPPGSDPPTSRGPNHYANPALEPLLFQRLPMHRKYKPWSSSACQLSSVQKTQLKKESTPNILKRHFFVAFR